MPRDDFPKKVVDDIAKRAGYQCSNPGCRRGTIGPSETNSDNDRHLIEKGMQNKGVIKAQKASKIVEVRSFL